MKKPAIHEKTDEFGNQIKHLGERALESVREGAGAADRIVHQNTYNVLAVGTLFGFVIGLLASRGYRCCTS